jgi:hypothetical protein
VFDQPEKDSHRPMRQGFLETRNLLIYRTPFDGVWQVDTDLYIASVSMKKPFVIPAVLGKSAREQPSSYKHTIYNLDRKHFAGSKQSLVDVNIIPCQPKWERKKLSSLGRNSFASGINGLRLTERGLRASRPHCFYLRTHSTRSQ